MKIITIKFRNDKTSRYDFIRFCEDNKISVYISWQSEDMLDNEICVDALVPKEAVSNVMSKYGNKIKSQEGL